MASEHLSQITKIGSRLLDLYLKRIPIEGVHHLNQANDILLQNGSILIASDHPNTPSTFWTPFVVTMLPARRETAILMKASFASPTNPISAAMRRIVAEHQATPLFVKTPQHEPDANERAVYNAGAIQAGNEVLASPGGVLFTFAQGTRNANTQDARPGLSKFAEKANAVLPMSTIIERGKPLVVANPLIPGKVGVNWCTDHFGENGHRVFADLVMTIIARPHLPELQGIYLQRTSLYDELLTGAQILPQQEERIEQLAFAIRAFENGQLAS